MLVIFSEMFEPLNLDMAQREDQKLLMTRIFSIDLYLEKFCRFSESSNKKFQFLVHNFEVKLVALVYDTICLTMEFLLLHFS